MGSNAVADEKNVAKKSSSIVERMSGERKTKRSPSIAAWSYTSSRDPLSDVGLFLVYWGRDQNTLAGDDPAMGTSAGFLSREQVAERYANASGRDVSQLDFYEMLASYKLAIILAGIHARYLMGKTVGEGFDHIGVMVETIANAALDAGNRSQIAALRG